VRRADNLSTFMCRLSRNLGASTSWYPQCLSKPVMGLHYLYLYFGCLGGVNDQNVGRIHSMKIDNSSIEKAEEFKYLGTTLTNQNSIQEEIKSRLKSGNACYYSVQNLLSSRLCPKI